MQNSLLTPREITPRNSVTLTADNAKVRGMLSSLLKDAARNAETYSSAAPGGSQERYDFAEAAFELDLAAVKLGGRADV